MVREAEEGVVRRQRVNMFDSSQETSSILRITSREVSHCTYLHMSSFRQFTNHLN